MQIKKKKQNHLKEKIFLKSDEQDMKVVSMEIPNISSEIGTIDIDKQFKTLHLNVEH